MSGLIAMALLFVASNLGSGAASTCDFTQYHPLHASDGKVLKRVEPDYPPEAGLRRHACATGPGSLRAAAERAALGWLFKM
jgi:hypothetical protein